MDLSRQELESAYASLEGPLYNFALRWVWNPPLAQELVQDAFVRVWQRRDRIERATLKALLYKTVQNLAINERRKARLRELTPFLDWFSGSASEASAPDAAFIRAEDLRETRAALEALPEELRRTLLLCQFSDLTLEEIGRTLGIPPGTVASRKNRALQRLREGLREKKEVESV